MGESSTIECAARYNAAAAREGWPSVCDHSLKFARRELADILALWRDKAGGGIPARSEMSPRLLKPFLPDLGIYERVGSGESRRYRVRLFGTVFTRVMGNLTGKFLDEALPKEFLPRWYATLDGTLAADAPLRFLSRSDTNKMSFLVAEYISAPLLAQDGSASIVLGAGYYDGSRPWRDVEAEARRSLCLA